MIARQQAEYQRRLGVSPPADLRERTAAARACFYCAPEPEPGWIYHHHVPLGTQNRPCPICNDDGVVPQGVKR